MTSPVPSSEVWDSAPLFQRDVTRKHALGKYSDMLNAADAWFRGTEVPYGPDGAVYLIDWNATGECHEATGVHRRVAGDLE